jgi:phosphate:Na+ symporter
MDFQRISIPRHDAEKSSETVRNELHRAQVELLAFLQENYRLVSLSIETNYRSIFDAAAKRIDYINYLQKELLGYFSQIVPAAESDEDSTRLIRITGQFDYLFQIHDSINDLFMVKKVLNENFIELRSDILLSVREISGQTLAIFDDTCRLLEDPADTDLKHSSEELQVSLDRTNREMLVLMRDPARRDVGALTNFVTYSRRLRDKLLNFSKQERKRKSSIASS